MSGLTLGETQRLMTRMLAKLTVWANDRGYELTLGDAYRDPRLHGAVGIKAGYGAASSCHKLRLAQDYNLFKDGKFLQETEDHKPLGEYWESIGGSWGGRFQDGNHYSIEWDGKR